MKRLSLIGLLLLQVACSNEAPSLEVFTSVQANEIAALEYEKHGEIYNPEAVIPPQCYTKTEGKHNPCYVCHQSYKEQDRSNLMNDGGLQGSYDFSDVGLTNSWKNLFIDRSEKIKNISDHEILTYINQNNYSDLITWMKTDEWSGVVPEIKDYEYGAQAFGENGLAKDGSMWVAFNYKPMPSTFWPTNGSTDDVAIRLPKAFYQISSETNIDVYFINLALLEISILDLPHTTTNPINEVELNIDIDLNGVLEEKVTNVVRRPFYVGDANTISLGHMLYPKGTEFIHSVRYLGVNDSGDISVAPRMKELRYMKKHTLYPLSRIRQTYYKESKEKHFENLPRVSDFQDRGIANGFGWMIWGFIEDEKGDLRQQNKEEQFFCAGCHKTIGTTIDHTFSFPRKLTGAKGWGYIDLKVLNDAPNKGESMGEYQTYMSRVSGGDEFRQNSEMLDKWFKKDGSIHHEKIEAISSIYELITPSKQRALDLNKAYKTIVEEQSYIFGREPMLSKSTNIFKEVDADVSPLQKEHRYAWDIRLDWDQ
ncbi:hypothetical protein NBRC116188_24470 [Oceaniserpentilla sp. 4NH20-0058]|uniref:hypothetical protein n=1 Tax=Oceaniserpentilla sp. 4NH20-0058 TaxID=3127660 RepID=UPI00310C781B